MKGDARLVVMELSRKKVSFFATRSGLVLTLYGSLAGLALLLASYRGDVDLYRIEGVWDWRTLLLLSPAIGLAIGLAVVGLSRMATHQFSWAQRLHSDFRVLLGNLSGREVLVLALASSIGEELLFRGALQPAIGVWPQAIVFALLHIGPGTRFLPWTLSAFALGLGFGYLFAWTGDLGAPIVAHFTINFLNLHYIVRHKVPAPLPSVEPAAADAAAG